MHTLASTRVPYIIYYSTCFREPVCFGTRDGGGHDNARIYWLGSFLQSLLLWRTSITRRNGCLFTYFLWATSSYLALLLQLQHQPCVVTLRCCQWCQVWHFETNFGIRLKHRSVFQPTYLANCHPVMCMKDVVDFLQLQKFVSTPLKGPSPGFGIANRQV